MLKETSGQHIHHQKKKASQAYFSIFLLIKLSWSTSMQKTPPICKIGLGESFFGGVQPNGQSNGSLCDGFLFGVHSYQPTLDFAFFILE